MSRSTSIESQLWLLYITFAIVPYFIISKKQFNSKVIILGLAWLIINIMASYIFGKELREQSIIRFIANYIFLPFFLLSIYGKSFLLKLEKFLFILTTISLPLFLLNYLFKSSFDQLTPVFKDFTSPTLIANENYWSIGIYVSGILQTYDKITVLRNCGFMWEPGYFAVTIVWGLIIHWLSKGIRFDKKFIIYAIALFTTFSTAGYIAFFLLVIAFYLKDVSLIRIFSLIAVIFIFYNYIYSLEFVGGKIDLYTEGVQENKANFEKDYNAIKLNRFQIAIYDINRVIRYPFGFGYYDRTSFEGTDVVGTNGLSGLLRMWGIPVFAYFMYLIYKFFWIYNFGKNNRKTILILFIALMLVFFSQSIHYNILTYFIIISSMTFKPDYEAAAKRL